MANQFYYQNMKFGLMEIIIGFIIDDFVFLGPILTICCFSFANPRPLRGQFWSKVYFWMTLLGIKPFLLQKYAFWALVNFILVQNERFCVLDPLFCPFWLFFFNIFGPYIPTEVKLNIFQTFSGTTQFDYKNLKFRKF